MANVFVWIKRGLGKYRFPPPTKKVQLDQVSCIFIPHVVGVQVNQEFHIRSSDDTIHNYHPLPKFNREKNVAMPFKGHTIVESFSRKELMIPIRCNVHPWMVAYINVVKHPYFAVTPPGDGIATISKLPPGKFTVEAVHETWARSKRGSSSRPARRRRSFSYWSDRHSTRCARKKKHAAVITMLEAEGF